MNIAINSTINSTINTAINPTINNHDNITKIETYPRANDTLCIREGLKLIKQGKVAVLLMAGGQGTRLGFDKPKGMFPLTDKTLFELHVEQLKKLGLSTWYVMTSDHTYDETSKYFDSNNFGVDIILFKQGNYFSVDQNGNKMLDSNGNFIESPNGSGGIYEAIKNNKILDRMELDNVEYVYIYNVDNVLTKIADPLMIGHCKLNELDCCCKSVVKKDVAESVGIFCYSNNTPHIIEYSNMSEEFRKNTEYNLASIGIYCMSFPYLKRMTEIVHQPYFMAHKKIPYFDTIENKMIIPSANNGYKPELFIFDWFKYCEREKFDLMVVDRDLEFFPIKDKEDVNKYLLFRSNHLSI
jgi:UDP-N-acetylglucosamine pyrophosphorylase